MAFNDKELEIINFGKQNKKTAEEIKAAVARYRTGQLLTPPPNTEVPPPEPGFLARVGADIQARATGNLDILDQSLKDTSLSGTVASGAKLAANTTGGITDVLGEAIRSVPYGKEALDAIGGFASTQFKNLTDALSNTKFFQEAAAGLPANNALENTLSTAASGGEIADSILATKGLAKSAQTAENTVSAVATKTGEFATEAGRIATDAATDLPSKARTWVQEPLKASVENVLKETPTQRFDEYVDVARKATLNNKNATPLEVAGRQAQEALGRVQSQLNAAGEAKAEMMKFSGVTGFEGTGIRDFKRGLQSFLNSKTAIEGDSKLIRDIKTEFDRLGDTPSAGQVDRFVDFAQDRIYSGAADLTVPVTSETTAAIRALVGQLNTNLKNQLSPQYRKLNSTYAKLVGIRNELNTKLGKEGEKGGALMKRVFSPSDANTKQLFADVLDVTGIDLVNEATLARYLMDVLGDARQKSMLEQLNLQVTSPTAGGITNRLVDYLVEKANSPEDLIRRARALTAGEAASIAKP